MNNLGTEFKVGLFTLISAVVIGYMFFVLSPDAFKSEEQAKYYTILDDAAGIIPKTHVKTNGVTIGNVSNVDLKDNHTKVELNVRKDIKIPKGSRIEIRTRGLLGDVFIEIVRTPDEGAYVEIGGYLPLSNDQVSMQQLVSLVGAIAKDVKQVTASMSTVLGGEKGQKTLSNIVGDIEKITANTREIVEGNKKSVNELVENLRITTSALRNAVGDKEKDLSAIIANVRSTTEDLKVFAKDIREVVGGENKEKIDRIIASFDTTMDDVEKTAKNVRLVSEKIERGEGTLGRLINDENAIAELEGAIKDIRDVLKPATKTQIAFDYHGEMNHEGNAKHFVNLIFKTRPDKFYLLGVVDHKDRVVETKVETLPSKPGENPNTVTRETINEKKALRFNLQAAKRWGFFQVRGGFFESTGGVGLDLYAFSDRIKFSAEAFDFDRSTIVRRTAHYKAYASILFFNHIYAMVGIDDPTITDENGKVDRKRNPAFFGAGLTFNDDDLKAIFGTAALMR